MNRKHEQPDRARIPERVMYAHGTGAYGFFEPYDDMLRAHTCAEFLTDPSVRTPVFVRFSTAAGSRGSADTVRDVRGFATKFHTRQGNYDLVGNNMPVFFIHDGIKFPDLVHAVKPRAQSAHDTLWDFAGTQPETTHMMMWLMSDRALPRSYRMMQGFGVHTFRLVDDAGQGTFVKFHWKPVLGTHSLIWDECQKIAGQDPDFNRRDLWDSIEAGQFPEWELGVQLIPEADEFAFDFDLLDPTKIVPEEQVPVVPVGRMVLDRNPENFFAETEQVAFHTANIVPGIDFTDDPLLQARNLSYLEAQAIRLGGIPQTRTSHKIPHRAESFKDHYSQATLFWNSMSKVEREHIVAAYRFELAKVTDPNVRERVVQHLNHVDHHLAVAVAQGIGVPPPLHEVVPNHTRRSPTLSQHNTPTDSIATRKVAVLAADGVDGTGLTDITEYLQKRGAIVELLAPTHGTIRDSKGGKLPVDHPINTMASVLYDAVIVPCGPASVESLATNGHTVHFVTEAFKHAKPLAAFGSGVDFLAHTPIRDVRLAETTEVTSDQGVVTTTAAAEDLTGPRAEEFAATFAENLAAHRAWQRPTERVPA